MSSGTPAPHSMMQDTELSSSKCLCDGECQCPIEALRDRCMQALLLASLADVSDERLRFIPRETIVQEISREFALKVLQRVANNNDGIAALLQQATNRIIPRITPDVCHCMKPLCTGSRVIFASLLFSGLHGMLLDFIREAPPEKCDSSLWELDVDGAIFGDGDPIFQQVRQMHMKNSLLFHWIYQLRALCLTAEESDGEIKQLGPEDGLENRIRLPWTSIEDAARPSSSASNDAPDGPQRIDMQSSKVQKVCIHRSHHKLDDSSNVFALKTFTDDFGSDISRADFEKELKANRSIPRNERIIPLLLAFEHRDTLSLLFPWTDLGDLRVIWKEHSSPRHDGPTEQQISHVELHSSQWILRECLGIASAVAYIHGLSPHCLLHADIKAENILGFLDRGSVILKLADFGHSKVLGSATSEVAVKGMAHTKTYRAPEYDTQKTVTTKFDVWSLGCLFLDFVTWDLMGWNEIGEFLQRRLDEQQDLGANHENMVEDTFFKRVAGPQSLPSRSRFQSAYRWITHRKDSKNSLSKNQKFGMQGSSRSIETQVRGPVTSQIETLRNHQGCDDGIRKLLNLIQDQMLVSDCNERAWSNEVRQVLSQISTQRS